MVVGILKSKNPLKGIIWKYIADLANENLTDMGKCPDPDFWSNHFPVWGICAPYIRSGLKKGDMVFFLPQKGKGFSGYVCSGVLVVERSIECYKEALLSADFSEKYKVLLEEDMKDHLDDDLRRNKPRTAKIRQRNLILGNREYSYWYGKAGLKMLPLLHKIGLKRCADEIVSRRNQSIHRLDADQTTRLYQEIVASFSQATRSIMQNPIAQETVAQTCSFALHERLKRDLAP